MLSQRFQDRFAGRPYRDHDFASRALASDQSSAHQPVDQLDGRVMV